MNNQLSKVETWIGFAKFVLGTVILGLVTIFVNKDIQNQEILLKEIEQRRDIEMREQEQLGTFIQHALNQDVGIRRRFSQYFATVTRSEDLKRGWSEYRELVEEEYTALESQRNQLIAKSNDDVLTSTEFLRTQKRIEEIERKLSPNPNIVNFKQLDQDIMLTRNFSLRELMASQTAERDGIDNRPDGEAISNLVELSNNILEPVRDHFGSEITIFSGYRTADLDRRVGFGRREPSIHVSGKAADIQVEGHTNLAVACWIKDNLEFDLLNLNYDIDGKDLWIDISYDKNNNRKQVTTTEDGKRKNEILGC